MENKSIVLARKPIEEKTITDNVLKYGTGGINIDGCRVR
jgi:site-specific DNA-methyltransferase (adenine-specific)